MSHLCDMPTYGLLAANTCRISYTTAFSADIIILIEHIHAPFIEIPLPFEEHIFSIMSIEA
ncbi:MAG: hypothetical protein J07HQW2_02001 [Haloquadratum walsbyi J07HQW2]|uniref:Uncharacterized protein n=1 Tax=Haloquadratum walsbyi J07HQW2 TaxID=1238425 RepID=U1NFG1_9EURY|nr:MAG: hypothetical protein J07HQW2_02001 [Haloquadratum walsbyi J07HQW2]